MLILKTLLLDFDRFLGLSRTCSLFSTTFHPGKSQNKIPGLSRFSRTRTKPAQMGWSHTHRQDGPQYEIDNLTSFSSMLGKFPIRWNFITSSTEEGRWLIPQPNFYISKIEEALSFNSFHNNYMEPISLFWRGGGGTLEKDSLIWDFC